MKVKDNPFEGYAVDLIYELSKIGDFNYTLYTSPDNKYGTQDTTGRPNGMINELFLRVSTPSLKTNFLLFQKI